MIYMILIYFSWYVVLEIVLRSNQSTNQQTIQLCKEYAVRDHSGEIGLERYNKLHQEWDDFDYFASCLLNNGVK
jgi:hypothetical protein